MKKVEVTIQARTSPVKAIAAFTDFPMLKEWWQVERALVKLQHGGVYVLAWDVSEKGFRYVVTGNITAYDPRGSLVVSNYTYLSPDRPILGPMSLSVKAEQIDSGMTEIYICQEGYRSGPDWDWYYESVKAAWPVAARALKQYLEK